MKYLLDVENIIVDYIKAIPKKPTITKDTICLPYSRFNSTEFAPNNLVYFVDLLDTSNRSLDDKSVRTPILIHLAIQGENGDTTMKVAPDILKDYINGYKDDIINSILIYKTSGVFFDKTKSVWKAYITGEVYWNRVI